MDLQSIISRKTAAKNEQTKVRKELALLNEKRQQLKNELALSNDEKATIVSKLLAQDLDRWQRPVPFSDLGFSEDNNGALGAVSIEYTYFECAEAGAYNKAVQDYKVAYKYLIKAKLAYLRACVANGFMAGITVKLANLAKRRA